MKTTLQVFSWIAVFLGGLTIISGCLEFDIYAIVGGGLFFLQGLLSLIYIDETEHGKA